MAYVHGRAKATLLLIDDDGPSAQATEMALEVFRQSYVIVQREETGRQDAGTGEVDLWSEEG